MTSKAYYNEIDPFAAQWLRNLILAGHIAPGDVDERSIIDVTPNDLKDYTQCHFFAGIGVWSYALRLAGWPDDKPVWTGSCPCQPFSAAGKRKGFTDERHLWPSWHWLIEKCRPDAIFGEQVANGDGQAFLDLISDDLEGIGYALGAVNFPACGVGAPHIRQRLWFCATGVGLADTLFTGRTSRGTESRDRSTAGGSRFNGVRQADTRREYKGRSVQRSRESTAKTEFRPPNKSRGPGSSDGVALGDTYESRLQGRGLQHGERADQRFAGSPGPVNGFWANAEWIPCRDGKARPIKPGTFPLAHEPPSRVGRLRAYGNAIVAEAAAEVIRAYMEIGELVA